MVSSSGIETIYDNFGFGSIYLFVFEFIHHIFITLTSRHKNEFYLLTISLSDIGSLNCNKINQNSDKKIQKEGT